MGEMQDTTEKLEGDFSFGVSILFILLPPVPTYRLSISIYRQFGMHCSMNYVGVSSAFDYLNFSHHTKKKYKKDFKNLEVYIIMQISFEQ